MAKLFRTLVSERKKRGDTSPVKTRPILVIAETVKAADDELKIYWGKENYTWYRPNMIVDFNPK